MDFHPPAPRHVAVAFLLHPDSIRSLEQIGRQRKTWDLDYSNAVDINSLIHDPLPPPPHVLLTKNSTPDVPEIDQLWGAVMKPFDIKLERPFLTAVKTISQITGLAYSSFRLIRSSSVWLANEFNDVDEHLKTPKSVDPESVGSRLLKHPVIDIFHSPFEREQLPVKPDLLYYTFLFQAIDLNGFSLNNKKFLWVTPLEVELQRELLKNQLLAPDLSLVLSTVYIPPLFNQLFVLVKMNHDVGTSILHRAITELLQQLLLDAWRVNCWVVKEPTSNKPEECDELALGAPYLSELRPRTVLIHLKSVITEVSRIRPTMSVINGLVRYIFHFIQQGSKYLDQIVIEKELRKLTEPQEQKSSTSFLKRLFSWGRKDEEEQQPHPGSTYPIEPEDVEKIDWNKFGSFEGSKPPPQTLYDKSMGRALFACFRYQLFIEKMEASCLSHADQVLSSAERVLILGGSSLVEKASCRFSKIIVCEGRPLFEGVKLAERLSQRRSKDSVYVISEAQIGIFIHHVDCCLVGAETILPNGSFINRIGTYLLALAASNTRISRNRIRSVPFFVIATTAKIMTKDTLDKLANAQVKDSLILVPPQHPEALSLRETDFAWPVLQESTISKGIRRDIFEDEEANEDDRTNEESDSSFKVKCHRIDAKASLGVILEGKEPEELTKAWDIYDLKYPNITVENIYSEIIPAHLVSGYITERGLLQPHEVADRAAEFPSTIDNFIKKEYPTWEF